MEEVAQALVDVVAYFLPAFASMIVIEWIIGLFPRGHIRWTHKHRTKIARSIARDNIFLMVKIHNNRKK